MPTTYPTYLEAVKAAQSAGYTHVEGADAHRDATLEPDEKILSIEDEIDFQSVPGQIEWEGIAPHDPEGPYTIEADTISNADGVVSYLSRQ